MIAIDWEKTHRDLQDAFKLDCGVEDMKDKEVKRCWREINKIGRCAKKIYKLSQIIEGAI